MNENLWLKFFVVNLLTIKFSFIDLIVGFFYLAITVYLYFSCQSLFIVYYFHLRLSIEIPKIMKDWF